VLDNAVYVEIRARVAEHEGHVLDWQELTADEPEEALGWWLVAW
jgi:hypothetical protein